ncbi:MAG TPA: flagellar motor switch protein FliM [Candidatus Sulfotelmatobacter sp.]|jgi:flagellar motor switch protein FliM|nr:flagellar motor switch protein FliM [Candidatus Sulfotelmatobacter sp.]
MDPAEIADASVEVFTLKGVRESRRAGSIRPHDFRQSGFLAASELRRIRQRHEQFIRSLAARMAMFLRLECNLQLSKVQIISYQKFIESIANPAHITLFKTEPLKGVSLLVTPPKLALQFCDRLLGGPAQMPEENRDLSDIETAISDQVATLIISEWCGHWPEMRDLHAQLVGHENNSKFLQTSPPDASMLIISVESAVAEQKENFHIVFPYATVEPLMRRLIPAMPETEASPQLPAKAQWNAGFDSVNVPLTVEWQGLKLSAGEITRLKPGDTLALDPSCAAQVVVRLGNVQKFFGRPGTSDGKWAVQLTSAISQ